MQSVVWRRQYQHEEPGIRPNKYNFDDNVLYELHVSRGDQPAKAGVNRAADLDRYTRAGISHLRQGYQAFAGQRDDGFYADIQSVFDLDFSFGGPNKPFDSQGGFNVHSIVLNLPLEEIGGDQQVVCVYATTSRRALKIINDNPKSRGELAFDRWVQVGRQGNPLFNEALVAIRDKDRYSRSSPKVDAALFSQYALSPELARVLIPLLGLPDDRTSDRTDIASIFIPDVIKVDLSTGPARLASLQFIDEGERTACMLAEPTSSGR